MEMARRGFSFVDILHYYYAEVHLVDRPPSTSSATSANKKRHLCLHAGRDPIRDPATVSHRDIRGCSTTKCCGSTEVQVR